MSWTQDWKNAGLFPAVLMRPRWMPVLDQILSRIPFSTYVPRICSGSGPLVFVKWHDAKWFPTENPPQFQIYCWTTSTNISLELLNSAHQPISISHLNCFHIRILLAMECLSIGPHVLIESMAPGDVLVLILKTFDTIEAEEKMQALTIHLARTSMHPEKGSKRGHQWLTGQLFLDFVA